MARYKCPQCGRRFGSVGEVLNHTQERHAGELPYGEGGAAGVSPARGMPSAEPGPVATERARRTEFDLETAAGGDDGGLLRPGPGNGGGDADAETQNTALGTIIALLVIAALIILNLLAGGE